MSTTVNHNEFGPPHDGSGQGQIDESSTADLAGNGSGGGLAGRRVIPGESAVGEQESIGEPATAWTAILRNKLCSLDGGTGI